MASWNPGGFFHWSHPRSPWNCEVSPPCWIIVTQPIILRIHTLVFQGNHQNPGTLSVFGPKGSPVGFPTRQTRGFNLDQWNLLKPILRLAAIRPMGYRIPQFPPDFRHAEGVRGARASLVANTWWVERWSGHTTKRLARHNVGRFEVTGRCSGNFYMHI